MEAPCIILGGLPIQENLQFLCGMKVEFIVTCFQERPELKGAVLPPGAYIFNFCIAGKRRQGSWEALRKLILPALEMENPFTSIVWPESTEHRWQQL